MRAKLQVLPGEPTEPEQAAVAVARALLASLPRQRPVTLGILAFGPHPGLTPTPWVLDGLLEALLEAERTPVNLLTLGDEETAEAVLRRTGREVLAGSDGRELVERPSPDRKVALRMSARARALTVPRELVGSSLVLLCPLVARPTSGRSDGRGWSGPLAIAAATLARAWGFGRRAPLSLSTIGGLRMRESDDEAKAIAVGRELLSATFSSAALLVDGTWAGALASDDGLGSGSRPGPTRLMGELADAERILGLAELGRLGDEVVDGVDGWLLQALGLERPSPPAGPTPDIDGSAGRWPTLATHGGPTHGSGPTRMADRAITGIRSQSQRLRGSIAASRGRPALPARVPGRFAGLWTKRWFDPATGRTR